MENENKDLNEELISPTREIPIIKEPESTEVTETAPETAPAPVVEPTTEPQPEPVVETPPPVSEPIVEEPKKAKKSPLPIIIILVALIALVVVGVMMLTKKDDTKEPENKPEENEPAPEPAKPKRELSEEQMKELYNSILHEENGVVQLYTEPDGINVLYNRTFSNLFKDEKVELSTLVTKENDKKTLAHYAAGNGPLGTFKLEGIKNSYERLFGGNSFNPADYIIDGFFTCKINNEDVVCTQPGPTGGIATPNILLIKYVSAKQDVNTVTITLYGVRSNMFELTYQNPKGEKISELTGFSKETLFDEANANLLEDCKYNMVFEIDEVGSKLLYVEPAK